MQFTISFTLAFCSDVNIYKKDEDKFTISDFWELLVCSCGEIKCKACSGTVAWNVDQKPKSLKPQTCRSFGAPACANSHGGNSIIQNPKSKIECPSNTQLITEHSGWFRTPPRVAILFAAFQSADASRLATAALSASNPPWPHLNSNLLRYEQRSYNWRFSPTWPTH